MPVKVRCPECEKVLNAPDRARGKAIKCSQCGSAVRVPVGKAAAAKPAKKVAAPPPSSSMMIANLDLDRLEDTQTRICPKCGVEVGPEDIECPECHVILETGLLSDEKKADLSRKGPNPKLYYKEFFKDGKEFWKTEKRLSFRLATSWIVFSSLSVCSMFLSLWAIKPLVRDFWMFLATITLLIPPGLTWSLHITIIDATMRKKKKLGKYTFDKFLGAAVALKLITWFLDIAAPIHIAAIVFLVLASRGMPVALLVAGALEVAAFAFASLLFPIASVHMAMPVTIRGWLLNKLSKPFFRTIPAVAYWCFFFYLTLLVPIACLAVGGVFSAKGIGELMEIANENTEIFDAKAQIDRIPKGKEVPQELQQYIRIKERPKNYTPLLLPSILFVVGAGVFGMTAVFSMRTNGLYGRYFMDRLDLETMLTEVVYVPKAKNLGELEAKAAALSWKPVLMGLGLTYTVALLLGGSIGMSFMTGALEGITYGLVLSGGLTAFAGFCWLIIAVAKGLGKKDSPAKFAVAVLLSGLVLGGIGGGLYATTDFKTGPQGPGSDAPAAKAGAHKP
jgi:hypothetical protein